MSCRIQACEERRERLWQDFQSREEFRSTWRERYKSYGIWRYFNGRNLNDRCGNWDNCFCQNKDTCHMCRDDGMINRYGRHRDRKCRDGRRYDEHFACFDCRISWKDYDMRTFNLRQRGVIPKKNWQMTRYKEKCRLCGKDGINMGMNFRAPKKRDKRSWNLIKFIQFELEDEILSEDPVEPHFLKIYYDAMDVDYRTLEYIFVKTKYKFSINHIANKGKQLRTSYPKHKREIPEFVNRLQTTMVRANKVPASEWWDILRSFVKTRAIARFWRKQGRLRREKLYAKNIIVCYWHRYSYKTPGSYHHRRLVKEFEELENEIWN